MAKAPVKKIKVSNVVLNVWENENKKGGETFTTQSVTLQKNYKKGEKWESSSSFSYNELLYIIMACQEALKDRYLKEEPDFLD